MSLDLQTIRLHAIDVARQAGAKILEYFRSPTLKITQKSISIDLVTEADKAAESVILDALLPRYPDHHFVGEESGGSGAPMQDAEYRWYIDPIDGTTNFAHGLPLFSVSIGLATRDLEPLVGVVYHPAIGEMFSAARGLGAWVDDQPLRVSAIDTLEMAMMSSGFPYNKATNPDNNLAQWAAMTPLIAGERRLGSAALDLAYVAAGRLDGYWEMNLNLWDVMAGILLVREAGGRVTDYRGSARDVMGERCHVVASNGHLHETMLHVLRESGSPLAQR